MSNAFYRCSPEQALLLTQQMRFFEAASIALDTLHDQRIIYVHLEAIQFSLDLGYKINEQHNPIVEAL